MNPALINIDEQIKTLKQSATYAMSLGARELFHTNFLQFILESRLPSMEGLQKRLRNALGCPIGHAEVPYCLVWREKFNLDLIIVPIRSNGALGGTTEMNTGELYETAVPERAVVVEAKLKSLPTIKQLQEYAEELSKKRKLDLPEDFSPGSEERTIKLEIPAGEDGNPAKRRLLLSPVKVDASGWTHVPWTSVAEAFESQTIDPIQKESPTLGAILFDYGGCLKSLLEILEGITGYIHEFTTSQAQTIGALVTSMGREELRKIRLHDLAGKYAFSLVAQEAVPSLKVPKGWKLNSYAAYSNQTPMAGFGLICEREDKSGKSMEISIGVQVQGTSYRHFLSVSRDLPNLEQICAGESASKEGSVWDFFLNNTAALPNETNHIFSGAEVNKSKTLRRLRSERRTKKYQSRITNLKAFNTNRFLYSEFHCADMTFPELKKQVAQSLAMAIKVIENSGLAALQEAA